MRGRVHDGMYQYILVHTSILQGCSDRRVAPGIRRTRAAAAGASGWMDSPLLPRRRPAALTGPGRGVAMQPRPDGASRRRLRLGLLFVTDGEPPPSSARAGERRCSPARTVQAAGDSDWVRTSPVTATRRPHRPGPGTGNAAPPGRCKPQVNRTGSALRQLRRPAVLIGPGWGVAMPSRPDGASRR